MDGDGEPRAEGDAPSPAEVIRGRLVRIHQKLGWLDEVVAYVNAVTDESDER